MLVSLHGFITWSGCGINAVPLQPAGRWRLNLKVDANNTNFALCNIYYSSKLMYEARALLLAFAVFVPLAVNQSQGR